MKNTVSILIAVIMGLFSFTACGSEAADSAAVSGGGSDIITEDDLEMTIDVPKTELKVGESVTVTARLYNKAGKDIEVNADIPEQEVLIEVYKKGTEPQFYSDLVAKNGTFKNETYIENTYEFKAEKIGEFQAQAMGCIDVKDGKDEPQSGEQARSVIIYSDAIDITVTE